MRNKQVEFNPYIYTLSKLSRLATNISFSIHNNAVFRTSGSYVTGTVSWKNGCQFFSYVYSTRNHWKCKYKENLSRWWGEGRENPRDEPLSLDRALARPRGRFIPRVSLSSPHQRDRFSLSCLSDWTICGFDSDRKPCLYPITWSSPHQHANNEHKFKTWLSGMHGHHHFNSESKILSLMDPLWGFQRNSQSCLMQCSRQNP